MIVVLVHDLITDLVTSLVAEADPDINVGNLELENGHDYLLEDGGFIVLE